MLIYNYNIVNFNGFILHASVTVLNENAYVFFGESGIGKSTQSKNWCSLFPKAFILNDDNPIVRYNEGQQVFVYGSPWSGKTNYYINEKYPLKALISIKKGKSCKVITSSYQIALREILPSCSRSNFCNLLIINLLNNIHRVIDQTKSYIYYSTKEKESAQYLYDKINSTFLSQNKLLKLIQFSFSLHKKAAFIVQGNSMYPQLVHDKTKVVLDDCKNENLKKGDIILARIDNRLVLHRVIDQKKDIIELKGDACTAIESCIRKDVIGKVIKIVNPRKNEYEL